MKKSRESPRLAIAGILLLLFVAVSGSTVSAAAESVTATRMLPAEPVSAGEFFTVRIEASDYGTFGQVVETLPAGFTYRTSTLDPGSVEVGGSTVRFYLLGETSFNYTVSASYNEGTYSFSGLLIDVDRNESEVGGDKELVVESASAVATRALPAEPVSTGATFTVGIEASGYGVMGQVVETLPAGFVYGTSTLDPTSVEVVDNTIIFYLFGDSSFNYTVMASNTVGTYYFSGILRDDYKKDYKVGGDAEMVVEKAEEKATATRALPEEPVPAGERFTVDIEASHYGVCGYVVETLPEGFVYEDSTLNPERVEVQDDTVEFTLRGEPSFAYTVTASDTEGTYTFSGILIDEDDNEYDISGDTEIAIEEQEVATAARTLPAEPVTPGATFIVEIEASGYGIMGQVAETLSEEFVYVESTLDTRSVVVEDNTVKFTLFGELSFTYTVKAPDIEGTYTFRGILKDDYKKYYEVGGDTELVIGSASGLFDTGASAHPYPSISGWHEGTIQPERDITIHKMYTYPCAGTGGHSEYAAFYNAATGEEIANGTWKGYAAGNYHYIDFETPFDLHGNETYTYTIKTGSYPQIIHEKSKPVRGGTITCTEFRNANGETYEDWIPAIRLE